MLWTRSLGIDTSEGVVYAKIGSQVTSQRGSSMDDSQVGRAESLSSNKGARVQDPVFPFNHRLGNSSPPKPKYKKKPPLEPVDLERMYVRPQPDVFTRDWNDGYNDGFDSADFQVRNLNYADGYRWGCVALREHTRKMSQSGSSNA